MGYPVYYVPAGDVLPIFFGSYDGGTGASATLSGLAVTDIEIYKDGSTTQRASDAGYTLLDTDGIDFDGITGINGFSIDTGDNTDAGFYAVGAWYTVVVSSVTVDSQTVNFIAAQFRIMPAESSAGVPKVDVSHISGSSVSTSSAQLGVNVVNLGGSAVSASAGLINANVTQISGDSTAADNCEAYFDGTGYTDVDNLAVIRSGTAQAGAAGTITLDSGASGSDDFYNYCYIQITGGTGANQARFITDYVGSTKVASISPNWVTNPSSDSVFIVWPFGQVPGASAPTASEIADAVWEEAIADHSGTAGSTAEALSDAGAAGTPPTVEEIADEVETRTIAAVTLVNGLAANTVTAAALAADAGTEIASAVWGAASRTITALDEDSTTLDLDATIRSAVGLSSANLDTQLGDLPTAAENAAAVWGAGTRTLTAIDEDNTTLDIDAAVRAAVGLSSANLDTQLGDLPTNSELSSALGSADDAVLSAIATVDNVVDAIKAQTDQLSFDVGGGVDANITHVIGDAVQESSTKETNWGGTE